MLKDKNRLSKDSDIQNVFKKGQIYFSPFFNVKILKNSLNDPRFCIVISTNISKKAVIRNKTKRQFRSIIQSDLENIKNYDIVILTKAPVTVTPFNELKKTFEFLIKKAGLNGKK
jgi:ribonuclease P protein component